MPFISDAASAIRSRFGFQDPADSIRATPDVTKSLSKENLIEPSTAGSGYEASAVAVAPTPARSFELPDDPSFWKEHNVQVIIRIRPLNSSELSVQGNNKCVRQESNQTVTWTGHPESRFTFDVVADENVNQEKLFKVAGVPMVENCVGGYNSCMFAYGQTGSGKTHTMLGDIEGGTRRHSVNCGMTPRVFEYLFSRIQKEKEARRDEKLRFTCKCSFLEIYNEQILDLLNPSSINLQIREDLKKGVYVENLTELEVASAREVMQQLLQGAANRKVAATNMNHASSRSHSVFTCVIESTWESQGVNHHRFARLNLVDLAGSERQKSSGAEGERLKEATNINKSLSTLGMVIMNLVSISNGKSLHVPYRDSKLTFLLQDSLGGNSKTIIIANISPSTCCSLETLSTLKFAQRAKFIKNNAIVNEDASGDVLAMRMQIQQLKKEVARLRGLGSGGAETQDDDTVSVGFPPSPGSFRWEGVHGSFSPLTSDRRTSQKKEYEVALVGAFRREKDKDTALRALAAENQAIMQLAKQREDEIQGLKMRLRFREAGLKRLEAVASGKISAETHLLKEKEEHLKEIEVLRAQVDRNQEVTRFAMENLRLKEEIRRLKSFYEEGERERMNEQITVLQSQLLEALDWKLMHEPEQKRSLNLLAEAHSNSEESNKVQELTWQASRDDENEFLRLQAIQNQAEMGLLQKKLDLCMEENQILERRIKEFETEVQQMRSSKPMEEEMDKLQTNVADESTNDMDGVRFNHQMELKTMVDAIAAASQREAEAHEIAISLSQENDELRMKLKVLIEDSNNLIELYERATAENGKSRDGVAQDGNDIPSNTSLDTVRKDMDMKKLDDLDHQLIEMHEENEKLMGLYEKAMQERDEFKMALSCNKDLQRQLVDMNEEKDKLICLHQETMQERDELKKVLSSMQDLEHRLMEMQEENEKLMGLNANAKQERDQLRNILIKMEDLGHQVMEMQEANEKLMVLYEKAKQETDQLKKMLSRVYDLERQLGEMEQENEKLMDLHEKAMQETHQLQIVLSRTEDLDRQLIEMQEENKKLMDQYEKAVQETDELKMMVFSRKQVCAEENGELECSEKHVEVDGGVYCQSDEFRVTWQMPCLHGKQPVSMKEEANQYEDQSSMEGCSQSRLKCPDESLAYESPSISNESQRSCQRGAVKELVLASMELDKAQEKLSDSAQTLSEVGFLEKVILKVDMLSREIKEMKGAIHLKEEELKSHKLLSLETQERRSLIDRKLSALKCSLPNFSTPIDYFEQREVRARVRFNSSTSYLDQKREDLARLQVEKIEVDAAKKKMQKAEVELRSSFTMLKSKLEEENQRLENEKVFFAIDNVENAEVNTIQRNWKSKALELLKSEEEKTKLQNEIKHSREKLSHMKKEIEDLNKKSKRIESEIEVMGMELQRALKTTQEMELALSSVIRQKEILLEIGDDGKTVVSNMIIEYQQCMFEAYLREEESKILEDELHKASEELDKLQTEKAYVIEQTTQILHERGFSESFVSERMQNHFEDIHKSIMEAKLLLGKVNVEDYTTDHFV
ncbi:hypothetical protein Dimus_009275 [Dionaea muscipula]